MEMRGKNIINISKYSIINVLVPFNYLIIILFGLYFVMKRKIKISGYLLNTKYRSLSMRLHSLTTVIQVFN